MSFLDTYKLDAYKLPTNPFAPREGGQGRPRQGGAALPEPEPYVPPKPVAVELPRELGAADLSQLLKSLVPEQTDDDTIMNAVARAEQAMRALPPLPGGYRAGPPSRGPAMTPTEGPDTGEENPNAGGAPVGYFKRLVGPESGGDATARNKVTGAGGLFQFLPSTWQGIMKAAPHLGLTAGGLYDPSPAGVAQQQRAADHYTSESMRRLVPALGRQPTMGELYALHFLGHSGGMALLQNLDRPVSEVVSGAAVEANPWLRSYTKKPARALLGRLEEMMG